MCGIIGVYCKHTESNKDKIRKLFYFSRIRGRHASGFAYHVSHQHLRTITKPIPIDQLIPTFEEHWESMRNEDGWVRLIAHARYSTSDIRYNQPIQVGTVAIVHNGVISQEDPSQWSGLYRVYCETSNDSEILLRTVINCGIQGAVDSLSDASIAAIVLEASGKMYCLRNGRRPLWRVRDTEGEFYASTRDILLRSGFKEDIVQLPANGKELQYRSVNE